MKLPSWYNMGLRLQHNRTLDPKLRNQYQRVLCQFYLHFLSVLNVWYFELMNFIAEFTSVIIQPVKSIEHWLFPSWVDIYFLHILEQKDTYILTYLLTYLTHLLTYLLTYLLHGAESFLRS